jgi:hypothetical protein
MNKHSHQKESANKPASATNGKDRHTHGVQGGTSEANRLAIVILEVLAGMRTPTDAAQVLGISLVRYYQLEVRALEGFVAALEPRPKGKQVSADTRLKSLEKQLEEAQRHCARQQALVRAAQRSFGVKAAIPTATNRDPRGRKKRRPSVRALRVTRALEKKSRQQDAAAVQQEASETAQTDAPSARDQAS